MLYLFLNRLNFIRNWLDKRLVWHNFKCWLFMNYFPYYLWGLVWSNFCWWTFDNFELRFFGENFYWLFWSGLEYLLLDNLLLHLVNNGNLFNLLCYFRLRNWRVYCWRSLWDYWWFSRLRNLLRFIVNLSLSFNNYWLSFNGNLFNRSILDFLLRLGFKLSLSIDNCRLILILRLFLDNLFNMPISRSDICWHNSLNNVYLKIISIIFIHNNWSWFYLWCLLWTAPVRN